MGFCETPLSYDSSTVISVLVRNDGPGLLPSESELRLSISLVLQNQKYTLEKRFSKFFLVLVKYKRLCTSKKGVYNSLVWIEQEVTFQLVKLLEMSAVFCSCCLEKFSSGDISGNH